MKLHIHFQTGELRVNELIEGATADQVVAEMQSRTAAKMNFLVAAVVRKMTPLQFAQEATRRYNAAMNDTLPMPQSCDEFVQLGIQKGFASIADG